MKQVQEILLPELLASFIKFLYRVSKSLYEHDNECKILLSGHEPATGHAFHWLVVSHISGYMRQV